MDDEEKMLIRLKKRDSSALDEIMDRYTGLVVFVIGNVAGTALSREDVEETAEDVFVALWEHSDTITPGSIKAWLCRVAKNKAYDRLRQLGKNQTISLESFQAAEELTVPDGAEEREISRLLAQAINKLDKKDREMLVRRYCLCQNSTDIGKVMGLNAKTVRTRLARARNKLKEILTEGGLEL